MIVLIAGLMLFLAIHLIPSFTEFRKTLVSRLTPGGYKGLFSLLSFAAIVLIVHGLKNAPFEQLYEPPAWSRHAVMVLMLPALYLFFSTSLGPAPSSAKAFTAHPMSWGVIVWALAHLLANGDIAHVYFFGTFLILSVISIVSGNARGLKPALKQRPPLAQEAIFILIIVAVYFALFWAHPYFTGVQIMGV